jgi:hypothetical protein
LAPTVSNFSLVAQQKMRRDKKYIWGDPFPIFSCILPENF